MKRYLTFYGSNFYPKGGMEDFIGDFNTIKEAKNCIEEKHKKEENTEADWNYMWANIYDTETKEIVYEKE